jgi:hypothetical protein
MTTQQTNGTSYNPQEHLMTVQTTNGPAAHYPFTWRQHEFRLRYPNGILDAVILQADLERDLVVVKVTACADDLGNCTGVGLATGSLTLIASVTERAKVQALADLGIGCAWPVLFTDDLDRPDIIQTPPTETNGTPFSQETSNPAIQKAGSEHHPQRTAETVQAFYAKTYQVKAIELEAKWAKFVLGITGRPLAKGPLSEEELNKLNSIITQYWQKQHGAREQQVVAERRAS